MSELSIHVCNRRSSFFRVVRGTPCEPSPCPGTAPELRWGTWCSCFCSFTDGASFSLTRYLDTWWCYQFIDKFVYHQSLFRELYYCYVTYILIISTLFLLLRSCLYLHSLLIFCHLTYIPHTVLSEPCINDLQTRTDSPLSQRSMKIKDLQRWPVTVT